MPKEQLNKYIQDQLSLGTSKSVIENNLRSNGWSQSDIASAFTQLGITQEPTLLSASSGTHKLLYAVIVVLLIVLAVGAYLYTQKGKVADTELTQLPETTDDTNINTQNQATTTQPVNNVSTKPAGNSAPASLKGPTVTKISPTSGAVGTVVTVSGSGFIKGSTDVGFYGSGSNELVWNLEPNSVTATSVTFIVPKNAVPATYVVTAGNIQGEWRASGSGQGFFTVSGVVQPQTKTPSQISMDDARVKSDLNQLRVMAEQYYDNNNFTYVGFCTNTDSGVELIWNELYARNVGGKNGVRCNTIKNEYAVSSTLNNGKYACVDSAGRSVDNLASHPTGTKCQ